MSLPLTRIREAEIIISTERSRLSRMVSLKGEICYTVTIHSLIKTRQGFGASFSKSVSQLADHL
jgi:hypothetical protein